MGNAPIDLQSKLKKKTNRRVLMVRSRVELFLCNDREMGGYTRAVSGQRLSKHVPAATDTKATTEEFCFPCGPYRDIISKGQG
jgi:hypothetical protein